LPDICGIPKADPSTIPEYDAAVDNLVPGECGEYGLDLACIFDDLQSFHGMSYILTNVMHDFCEIVAIHDVMSVLKVLSHHASLPFMSTTKFFGKSSCVITKL
jgi:hypothetical protein